MNLFLLSEKQDKNLVLSPQATRKVRVVQRQTWRGFDIAPSETPQIRLSGASAFYPFYQKPEDAGWRLSGLGLGRAGRVRIAFTEPGTDTPAWEPVEIVADANKLTPATLPWTLGAPAKRAAPVDLVMHVTKSGGPVFLGVHKALDRAPLIALCKGRGLEIGPGSAPQIMPAADVDVTYIEQKPPEEWRALYDRPGRTPFDAKLWERYRIGGADNLPVEDGSLDFIFASHVFEHLANPLGHLELWGRKLRKGGRIAAVVPDIAGARDYAAELSTLEEAVGEYEAGGMAPEDRHYARFSAIRGGKDGGKSMRAKGFSIHVHFYTHANMARLLEEAVRRFGFAGYAIVHTPNHKDFHFTLEK